MPHAGTNAATNNVWDYWSEGTASATTSDVWGTWTSSGTADSGSSYNPAPCRVEVGETEEERELRLAKQKERADERQAARNQAEELLKSLLTAGQRKHLDEVSSFLVKSESERMFRIRRGSTVEELNERDEVIARYCIHPPYSSGLPAADTMLAQKLMLEMNEAEFMNIANRS